MMDDRIRNKLEYIYGRETGITTAGKLINLIDKWRKKLPEIPGAPDGGVPADQTDAIMISYGDNIQSPDSSPLSTLKSFADKRLQGVVSGIHILPFSPYSSDDGFSVMDYREVNPDWGTWDDISAIGSDFRLMADLVLNHCSAKGTWFRKFLKGDSEYENFFITVEPGTDLSAVFRPRALPLLLDFEVNGETKKVWTTFSDDQVDLNFANPDVFLEFIDILLDYVGKGVRIIRLDAIGFLWKEIGTSCMHHPKTHEMVKLFRLVLAETAPGVILITETNVPHKENISYFGDGTDEAHMVYQFTLPPLTLDAYLRGDASKLSAWAASLPEPNSDYTFFNFLASHDGVGVLPAKGYLSDEEIEGLIRSVRDRGGLVSYKATPDGDIPYELNVSYRDAIAEKTLSVEMRVAKFLSSQAVMLSMAGMPGIYIHSLLGSGNWKEGVELTGVNRTINREKLSLTRLLAELDDPGSLRYLIFNGYSRLLKARSSHKAFHPTAMQKILDLGSSLFALERTSAEGRSVLCLQSVAAGTQEVKLPEGFSGSNNLYDIIGRNRISTPGGRVKMSPWQVLWLVNDYSEPVG
jgi:sucrose phosphorylase